MAVDPFTERLGRVRERFVSALESKIEDTYAAIPDLSDDKPEAVGSAREGVRGAPVGGRGGGLVGAITRAVVGFAKGVRFANLGGCGELLVPRPQPGDGAGRDLVLVLDDVSAHAARRNLE